jgi:SAM-dependent methyltransferase
VDVDPAEVRKLAAVERRHWWYAERRTLVRRMADELPPGVLALDVGAAGGGNSEVLRDLGLHAVAVEYGEAGAEIARVRGLPVIRGDAQALPIADFAASAVVAFDVLEHLADDVAAVREMSRVLRPGGLLLVAVPADPRLWSQHDEAVGHLRRYTRQSLRAVLEHGELDIEGIRSWNVLLRPVVRLRRSRATGSDLGDPPVGANAVLRAIVATERVLPVGRLPGVSLIATARRRS